MTEVRTESLPDLICTIDWNEESEEGESPVPNASSEESFEQEEDDDPTKWFTHVRITLTWALHKTKFTSQTGIRNNYFPEIVSPPPQAKLTLTFARFII